MKFLPLSFAFIFFALNHTQGAEVLTVRLPEGALQPRAITVSDGSTDIVFLEGDPKAADVKIAVLSSAGTLGAPLKINSAVSQAVAKGTVRGPALAVGAQGMRHLLWHGKMGSAANGTAKGNALWYTRVTSSGRATEPVDMMGETAHLDGGAAVAADAAGNVWLVWHALPPGKEGESERRIFIRHSSDNGASFSSPWFVKGEDAGVCACCGLTAATAADGSLQVLYRAAENTSRRGVRLIRLPANAKTDTAPELLQKDLWEMPGCPMTTAAMLPNNKDLITAWISEYRLQFTGWKGPVLSGKKAMQNHPRLARNASGETLLTWTEGAMWGKGGELVVQAFTAKGEPAGTAERHPLPTWTYGACAALPDGRFVAVY